MPKSVIDAAAFQDCLGTFMEEIANHSVTEMEALAPLELKKIIQKSKLARLTTPKKYNGEELNLVDTIQVIQLVAEHAPSLSIMLCMHYHVVATLAVFTDIIPEGKQILRDVGEHNALVASAFAEGVPGRDIFTSTVISQTVEGGVLISGSKKPCTMTTVADYYATFIVDCENKNFSGLAFVKHGLEGITTKEFWPSELLKAADSNQINFKNVMVPKAYVKLGFIEEMTAMLSFGLAAFNLMISAAYLGITTRLSKKLPAKVFEKKHIYVELYGYILQAHYSTIALANELAQTDDPEKAANKILILRYRTQKTLKDIVAIVCENIGGMNFLKDPEVLYLLSITNFIAFHPISRSQFEA
ncbi:MAG: acyl-CoA dehydrogenase family protein [Calothrix sp. MO_167.B42]|nr:acyl-CoA dehydrogenase family protein [Calothrix sp. MO_167.B42]